MQIRLTKLASRDLDSVEAYISEDNPQAAIRAVLNILDAIEDLVEFPNLGRPGRILGTRELVISRTPYIVVYKVSQNVVWVLRVIHAARKWPDEAQK